jgi:hypothetical protein
MLMEETEVDVASFSRGDDCLRLLTLGLVCLFFRNFFYTHMFRI